MNFFDVVMSKIIIVKAQLIVEDMGSTVESPGYMISTLHTRELRYEYERVKLTERMIHETVCENRKKEFNIPGWLDVLLRAMTLRARGGVVICQSVIVRGG